MPRRGEESSPAPRRSPRAAVKASASPSPIIRASRSQSAVKQSTPKTRTASPSPKAKTPTRSTKSKAKEETPKATSQRSPRTPAGKQSQGDTKKTAASSDRGSRTSARQSAAKTSSSTKAAKGRQKKTVEEEEEEEDDDDGEEEEEKEEESEAEVEPATPTTPAVKGGRGSRRKSQTEAKETPTPPPARSRSTRGQATPASADRKAQAAPATRKGRSTSASAKETAVEVADKYEEEGKLEAEEEESQNMKQTESRSRRSLGRRSEDAATPVTPEVDGSKGRRAAARSRSRGLEKKDEDEVESAPAVVEVEEPKGRASRARSRGQSKDGAGGSSSGRGDPVSKAGLEDKKGREKETAAKGAKPEKVEEDEAQPSELPSTPDTKSRKRGATHVEKSPEVVVSPASKKKRVTKGATPGEEDKPATTEASPGKKKAKEEEEGEEATKEKEKAKEEDSKPGKGPDEAGSQPPVTAAAVPSLLSTGSKASDRVETDMEVDESPVVKQGRTPSPKKTLSMKQTPPPPSSAATTTTTTTTAAAASAAISSPKKAPTTTTTTPVTVQQSTTTAAAKVATPSLSPGVTDLTKTSSPVKPQAKPQVGVNISKEATVVKLPSPVPPVTATPAAEKKQPSESPAKCAAKHAAEDAAKTVSKSESAATKSAPKASPASELAPVTSSVPKTAEIPARTPPSAGGGATAVAGVGADQSTLTPKSNSETVSAKTSKDVTAAPLKGSPLKPDPVAVSGGSSAPSPAAGQTTPKPQAQPADKAAPEKTIKPLMAEPVVGAVGAANAPTIQATSAKPASISTEKTPPAPPTTPTAAAAAAPQTKVTSSPPSSRPCAVPSAGSLPAKSPVKSEVKPAHIPSLMSARPFSDVGHTGSAARSHTLPLHGSPAKLLPTPAKLPQGPTEGPTGSKGVEISAKPAGNSSPQAPKAMGQPSAQSSPAKAPGHTPMSTAGPKPSGTDSVSGRPSHQGPGPVVSSVIKPTDVKPSTPQQPVASRVHGEKPLGAPVVVAPTGSPLKPGQQPAGAPLHPLSTAPHNVYSKSVPPAHVSPATAAPPQRIPPLCKPTPVPTGAATPGKVTPRPNNPAAIPPLMSKPLLSSTQVPPKPVVGVTSASGPTPLMEAKTMSGAAAMDHKQNRPHFSDVGKPQASSAATIRPLLPPDATPGHPAHHSPLLKPPMSTPDLTTTPPARKTFSPAFLSNQTAAPKTASSPADAAAMSRLMGAMPPKAPPVQEGTGFSKVAGSPAAGVAASKSPGAQTVKPQVTHMTGVVTSKPAVGSVTNVSSLKPQITHMTGTVPPKVLPPSPALSKPSVTHMAGVASQKPQVTHMAGVAPPKPMMQPSDTSSPSKPVVVRAVGSVTSKPAPGQSPLAPSPAPSHGGNIPGDSDRTKSQPLPADPSRYVSPSKTADPVDMSQKPPQGAQHAPRPQGSPASHAKGFTVEQKCEQLQHSAKSAVAPEANKPKPLVAAPGNTDVKSSPVKPANSQDSFQVKSLVSDSNESRPIIVGGVGTPHKVPATTTTTTAISSSQKPAPVTVMATTPGKGQQHTGSSVNNPAAPQLNKPPTHLATPGHHPAPPGSPSSCGPGPAGVTAAAAASPLVTSCGTSKAASVDVINGAKRSLTTAQQQQQQQSQQVCDLSKKRKADSAEEGDLRSSKKAHTAEEEAKLVANGQKLSGAPLPATTRVSSDAKVSKPESMEVSQSGSNVSDNLLAGYVVVNRGDVPPKDSAEVRQSLPKTPVANPNPSSLLKHPVSTPPPPLMMSKIAAAAAAGPGSSIGSSPNRDTLLSRTFIFNPELPSNTIMDKSRQFSVVSYNILADCHFSQTLKDRYPAEEKHFLELAVRHKRLMAELSYIDADVVCLQEVEPEYYSKTLSPDMQKLGYEGFYKKRVHENYDEGETTFYKTSRFSDAENTAYSLKQLIDKDIQEMSLSEEVKEAVRRFMCLPDVLLVTRLRCKNTGKFITVGNVHINWGQFKLPNVQCVQIARAIREVVNRAGSDSNPHVICGDFNSSPLTPGYQLASEGYLTDAMIQVLQSSKTMEMPDGSKSALVDHLWEGFQHTSSSLNSAYAVVQRKEPGLTTLTKHTRECLDYVFYSSTSLEAVGVLQVPSRQTVLDSQRIPNRTFPSDHLSLKAVLAFK